MWAISDDMVFHTMLVGICGIKTGDEELRKFVGDGIKGVNAGDKEATNSGSTGCAGPEADPEGFQGVPWNPPWLLIHLSTTYKQWPGMS